MQVSFTNWGFIIDICITPYAFPALLITYQYITQNLFSMVIETYFDQKVPWNFLNNIWTTPVVPWNSMELKLQNLKFHGIPWNSMEFCPDPKFHGIPWNFLHAPEFHGISWNSMELLIFPKKSSTAFHFLNGIPWNLINFIFKQIIFLNNVFGIWLMIRCYLAKISQKRYILRWFQYRNSYFEHPSVSENGARSAKMACCFMYYSNMIQ